MSELQLAMIVFAVMLVAVVWGYNTWQLKKQRRQVESSLPPAKPDVLMAGRDVRDVAEPEPRNAMPRADRVRREPEFGAAATSAVPREPTFGAAEPSVDAMSDEPALTAFRDEIQAEMPDEYAAAAADGFAATAEESTTAVPPPAEWADGRADCLLRIEFVEPVAVAHVWAEQLKWSAGLDKPVHWLGYDEYGAAGRWRNLVPQDPGTVVQVAAALQLADRRGAVSEATLTAFLGGMHALAKGFSGLVELPSPGPVLAVARELDGFCAGLDVQLALHVIPRPGSLTSMLGSRLAPVIENARLKRAGDRYVAEDAPGQEAAFSLAWQAATAAPSNSLDGLALTGLVFSIDVPRVVDGMAAFDRMVACAKQCAEVLGGQLSDAQHKPLADTTIAAIRTRIGELQANMERAGIAAGGIRALRLFS
jgi:FtsZ-interacting cell division protein ZipA